MEENTSEHLKNQLRQSIRKTTEYERKLKIQQQQLEEKMKNEVKVIEIRTYMDDANPDSALPRDDANDEIKSNANLNEKHCVTNYLSLDGIVFVCCAGDGEGDIIACTQNPNHLMHMDCIESDAS
eukprot:253084_1